MKNFITAALFITALGAPVAQAQESKHTYLICYQETKPGTYDMTIPVLEVSNTSGDAQQADYIPHRTPKHKYTFDVVYAGHPEMRTDGSQAKHQFLLGTSTPDSNLSSMFELFVENFAPKNTLAKGYLKVGDNFGGQTISIGKYSGFNVGCKAP